MKHADGAFWSRLFFVIQIYVLWKRSIHMRTFFSINYQNTGKRIGHEWRETVTRTFLFSYTCFYAPKSKSPCLAHQHDVANFKGPDGLLLCYKTAMFDEIKRHRCEEPFKTGEGKQVWWQSLNRKWCSRDSSSSSLLYWNYITNHHRQHCFSLLLIRKRKNLLLPFVNNKPTALCSISQNTTQIDNI